MASEEGRDDKLGPGATVTVSVPPRLTTFAFFACSMRTTSILAAAPRDAAPSWKPPVERSEADSPPHRLAALIAATLPGVPLYEASGYTSVAATTVPLPNGEHLPIVRMREKLRAAKA